MTELRVVLIVLAVGGWTAFLSGFVWNGVTSLRRPRSEASGLDESATATPASGDDFLSPDLDRTWFRGQSASASWSDEMSFAELKRGVRDGYWRRSARLQQFVLMVAGFLLGLYATLLLVGLASGPLGALLALAVILYVTVQITRGFMRA